MRAHLRVRSGCGLTSRGGARPPLRPVGLRSHFTHRGLGTWLPRHMESFSMAGAPPCPVDKTTSGPGHHRKIRGVTRPVLSSLLWSIVFSGPTSGKSIGPQGQFPVIPHLLIPCWSRAVIVVHLFLRPDLGKSEGPPDKFWLHHNRDYSLDTYAPTTSPPTNRWLAAARLRPRALGTLGVPARARLRAVRPSGLGYCI